MAVSISNIPRVISIIQYNIDSVVFFDSIRLIYDIFFIGPLENVSFFNHYSKP